MGDDNGLVHLGDDASLSEDKINEGPAGSINDAIIHDANCDVPNSPSHGDVGGHSGGSPPPVGGHSGGSPLPIFRGNSVGDNLPKTSGDAPDFVAEMQSPAEEIGKELANSTP